jgi:hypothetical protein
MDGNGHIIRSGKSANLGSKLEEFLERVKSWRQNWARKSKKIESKNLSPPSSHVKFLVFIFDFDQRGVWGHGAFGVKPTQLTN